MSTNESFKLALIQMACGDDPADNLARALGYMQEAAAGGAQLICLPELFRSRYFCQREDAALFDLAEPIPGSSTQAVGVFCAEHQVSAIASIFEKRAPGLYHNTAAMIGPDGKSLGLYRKMHIPDDPQFYEKFYFTPGDLGFRAFDTAVGKIGILICWDQWYPEAARLTALQGAGLLCYPTAIGWLPQDKADYGENQREAWRTIQRSHAIANGVFVAAANRVGWEPTGDADAGIEFWGSSFICGPDGDVIAEAPADAETILFADIDLNRIEQLRRGWPFLRDRRVDAYQGLLQRYGDTPAADESVFPSTS